jgi:hypothetical protein
MRQIEKSESDENHILIIGVWRFALKGPCFVRGQMPAFQQSINAVLC